jgi:peptidyl-prolyl cis-trans isomerase C
MPKAILRAALIAGAAFASTLAATPAPAQETEAPATPDVQTPEAGQPGVTQTQADPNQVVARINGVDVTRRQVIDSAIDLPEQVRANIDQVFPLLVKRYVGLQLLAEKGRADSLAEDPEVKKIVADAEDQAIRQIFVTRYLDQQITDLAIKSRYDQKLKENPPPEEVRAAHILVATEDEAKALIEQLNGGADFAALAKEKSTDKGSGANGGALGWFAKDVMVKEFADAAFAMQPGDTSKAPVKSQFGFHIIKLEEKRTQPAPSMDSLREQIRAELAEENVQALVAALRKDAKVEVLGPDGEPLPEEMDAAE